MVTDMGTTMATITRTTTATCTAPAAGMSTEPAASPAALLQLIWLASPALPVGGFSYSEALEAAVDSGRVTAEADASRWLRDQLDLAMARSELPLLAQALAAWRSNDTSRVRALNDWALTTRESRELR